MQQKENILGYEKIGKLIRKFAIPCIISLVVNSLYNIVDQIFIGWGVGYLGNGATNIVFPITMICLAFGLMFGDGSSAYLSLKLGEKKKEEATKGVGNGISLSILVSLILCAIGLIFLPKLLNIFGCTDVLRNYALDYGYIIVIGIPFMMIGTTLNSIIRADGNPKYAMGSMVIGAILNIILDPIFIFVFKWGVRGAAIATIMSQLLTFVLNLIYIRKFKSIKFSIKSLKLNASAGRVSLLGISSFITQMSIVVVIAAENNLLKLYGASSEFGSEIPITVLGIVMKISQILNSIVIGIAAGSQPIIGYNYGAGKYDRVKKTLKIVLISSVIVSAVAFILFQTIPDKLISIFGSGNDLYIKFACLSFRIYLMLCVFNGIQIPAGIFFQAIGKSGKSAFISLSRQILFLIPAMIIFGKIFGIIGVLYSGPFADGLAFVISSIFLTIEIIYLNKQTNKEPEMLYDSNSKIDSNKKHIVITISREYGSGGRYIGKLVADNLKIKLYDKEVIKQVSKNTGMSEEYVESNEQKRNALDTLNTWYYSGLNNSDELFIQESNIIKELASKSSCVIIGRCADYILKDNKDVINVFIYNSKEDKVKRATKMYGLNKDDALKKINKINKLRKTHYNYYTKRNYGDPTNYDLCINSDSIGVENAANLICGIANK